MDVILQSILIDLLKNLPKCDGRIQEDNKSKLCTEIALWQLDRHECFCQKHYAPSLWGHSWIMLPYAEAVNKLNEYLRAHNEQ